MALFSASTYSHQRPGQETRLLEAAVSGRSWRFFLAGKVIQKCQRFGDSKEIKCGLEKCAVSSDVHPPQKSSDFLPWAILSKNYKWLKVTINDDDPCNDDYCRNRRKFRSQTSDSMQRWKSRGGKSQRGEVKKWEDQRREKVRRKKMQVREKVGKSRFTVFFHWFVAPEGRKVTSLKRRVWSHLARWEMKSCTPLWREAHFQVKMYKASQLRSNFRSCDVEKVHSVVARSTFPSKNAQNTPGSDDLYKLRCRKSARGAKHISKSKCTKHLSFGAILEAAMSKECMPLWLKMHKTHQGWDHF